jgi:glycosyltransferase involved in cell wall biosynthesis
VDVLLDAFRRAVERHPGARLTVIGDGADRARLEEMAADLVAGGRVVFRGWLGKAEVAECLAAASVVAVPSLWPEIFGRVVLEAFQTGRPVVASRSGGLPELISDDNGLLVDPGDVQGLADALAALLGDRATLERLGKGAAQTAERYGIDAIIDAHEEHYEAVLAARR